MARAWRTAGSAGCTTSSFHRATPARSSSRSFGTDVCLCVAAASSRASRASSRWRVNWSESTEDRRRSRRHDTPDTAIQSFKAVRASPADARDAAGVRSLTGSRRPGPLVAPRMNSTAQVAHIAQMPNTTSHFSISPVL
ncbi:hypothetical protein Bxe_A0047 [Paraburkholderia xenovorans LB400]|uniref:Uncharacterized protein n=1 Tax=Paraburkholderia xenovorans (strain LB400) TaxID=266265 RepID=Q13SQ9_PARXL|nr:hypothetical protein Bxe_A0047 [Paraburkholderia xenovorans LB400]